MNYFFGINDNLFKSEIQIPLFQNRKFRKSNLKLFKSYPKNSKWVIEEVKNKKINDYFFILKNNDILNNEIFFLADDIILDNFDENELKNFNNFTDTTPAYRVNLKIYLKNGGFSSYQSEYPYSMVSKKGTLLSSVSSLANIDTDQNYILIRNIFAHPIEESFNAYFVNYKTKKIEESFQIKTNYTNRIAINKKLINPNIFLITDKFLGIPMYVSIKNNFISFEHTHPPHEYILSENRFVKVTKLKEELNEIIS